MPIVSDDGIYEDELHRTVATLPIPPELKRVYITKDEVPPAVDPGDDGMVITPEALTLGRELDNAETNPSTGTGLEVKYNFESVDWSKMNQEFGSLKSTSKEDTAVVATTASPLVTIREGDIKESMDVGMGAGPASIAGVRAATIPKSALYLAQDAERQGFSADEIFKSTGFFKGADKAWKWEIDDSVAKLNERWADNPSPTQKASGMKIAKLPEVINHPELYEAYPQLKNYQVIYDNNFTGIAEFSGEAIRVGKRAFSGDTPAYKDKSIIMHEVQHAIQDIEGFAKGGAPLKTLRGEYKLKYAADVDKLRPEAMSLFAKERNGQLLSEKEQGRLDYLKAVFNKYNEYQLEGDRKAYEHYLELAGEVEARNVQSRVDLTPSERMKINPIDSEDVKRSEQLVGRQASGVTPYVKIHPYDKQVDFLSYE
jgi:hypothetical protein